MGREESVYSSVVIPLNTMSIGRGGDLQKDRLGPSELQPMSGTWQKGRQSELAVAVPVPLLLAFSRFQGLGGGARVVHSRVPRKGEIVTALWGE